MEVLRLYFVVSMVAALLLALAVPSINAQAPAPAPTSDAAGAIDQGVAYLLMLVALAVTYMLH